MHPIIVQMHSRKCSGRPSIWDTTHQLAVQILGKGPVKQRTGKKTAYHRNSFHRPAANMCKPPVANGRTRGSTPEGANYPVSSG
jgi:hypothetical protein